MRCEPPLNIRLKPDTRTGIVFFAPTSLVLSWLVDCAEQVNRFRVVPSARSWTLFIHFWKRSVEPAAPSLNNMGCLGSRHAFAVGTFRCHHLHDPVTVEAKNGVSFVAYRDIDVEPAIRIEVPGRPRPMVLEFDYPLLLHFPDDNLLILMQANGDSVLLDVSSPNRLRCTIEHGIRSRTYGRHVAAMLHSVTLPSVAPFRAVLERTVARLARFYTDEELQEPQQRPTVPISALSGLDNTCTHGRRLPLQC